MGVSCLLFLLSLVPLITLSNNYDNLKQYRPHRMTIFSLELVLNGLSFMMCVWVMYVESRGEDHGEQDSLLQKAKQQGKAVIDWRPPKSWV